MENENPVKVRLEYWKRYEFLIAVGLSAASFILCLILALTLSPTITIEKTSTLIRCPPGMNENCISSADQQNITYDLIDFTKFHQLLYFTMLPISPRTISTKVSVNITLTGYDGDHKTNILKKQENISFECVDGICESYLIFYLPYISHDKYRVEMFVNNLIPVEQIDFTLTYINKEFSKFALAVKSVFLVLSIGSMTFFLCRVRKVPFRFWGFQTRILGLMGVSLIIFNEPLLGATVTFLDPHWSGISVFCNVQFIACLILYWLFSLQDFVQFKYKLVVSIIEIVSICILFSLIFALYYYVTVNYRYNPTFNWSTEGSVTNRQILGAIIFFLVAFALWTLVLTVWSCVHCKNESKRGVFFRVTNGILMVITFLATGTGVFQPVPRAATMVLISVALFNIYFMLLMTLFTPSLASYNSYKGFINQEGNEIYIPDINKSDIEEEYRSEEIKVPNNI